MWPTLGSRTAKEQEQELGYAKSRIVKSRTASLLIATFHYTGPDRTGPDYTPVSDKVRLDQTQPDKVHGYPGLRQSAGSAGSPTKSADFVRPGSFSEI